MNKVDEIVDVREIVRMSRSECVMDNLNQQNGGLTRNFRKRDHLYITDSNKTDSRLYPYSLCFLVSCALLPCLLLAKT